MTTATTVDDVRSVAPVSFGRLVSTELLKLRTTRLWWGLLITGLALAALSAGFGAGFAGRAVNGQASDVPGLDDPAVLRGIYGSWFGVGYLITMTLGILGMAGEYRHQTITPSLLAVPRRGRLVLSKLAAYFLAGVGYAAAMAALTVILGGGILLARGASIGLTADGVARTIVLSILGCGLWAVFGLGLATLIRNQIAALIVALTTQIIVEPLLRLALAFVSYGGSVAQYFPSAASGAIVAGPRSTNGGDGVPVIQELPWWGGVLTLVGYGLFFAAVGVVLTNRRDVT